MKQKATITVIGTQSVDSQSDTIEITSEGTFEKTNNGIRLIYNEYPDEKTTILTTLTIAGELVQINRLGEIETSMTIQQHKHHICHYSTAVGEIVMGTYGEELAIKRNSVHLSYNLDINSELVSRNKVDIKFKLEQE